MLKRPFRRVGTPISSTIETVALLLRFFYAQEAIPTSRNSDILHKKAATLSAAAFLVWITSFLISLEMSSLCRFR
jgi:hypothetical protein